MPIQFAAVRSGGQRPSLNTDVALCGYGYPAFCSARSWIDPPYTLDTTGSTFGSVSGLGATECCGGYGYAAEFTVASAPEPATLGLMVLGLAGVGFAVRRRKN